MKTVHEVAIELQAECGGDRVNADQNRTHYFAMLTHEEQCEAVKRLAASGMNDYGIAAACGFAVEQVRTILGKGNVCEGCE